MSTEAQRARNRRRKQAIKLTDLLEFGYTWRGGTFRRSKTGKCATENEIAHRIGYHAGVLFRLREKTIPGPCQIENCSCMESVTP